MIRKAINKVFKSLGYLPANELALPKHVVVEHSRVNYIPIRCVEKVDREYWRGDGFKDHVKQRVKMNIAREIAKHIDIVVKDSDDPYKIELHANIFVAK